MRTLLLLVALVALSGCETMMGGGASIGRGIRWTCDHGASFRVSFTTSGAHVSAGGQNYALPHARSASDARYANGATEYWEHAGSATLTGARGGPYTNCHRG